MSVFLPRTSAGLQGGDMKKQILSGVLIVTLNLFLFPVLSSAANRGITEKSPKEPAALMRYKDYHALVVGVSNYESWPDLPNAANDAREVAAALKASGFDVQLVLDPASEALRKALGDMVYSLGNLENRALLFYFAGHGETLGLADGTELGFIVPSDCPLKKSDPIGFDSRAISMKDIEMLALKVKTRHVLMLFDSCFSGSLFNMVRAAPVDITEKSALPVRQFITAGAAGEQVPDRSVFKEVFLRGITGDADLNDDGYVTGSELGMHLQQEVVNYTRGGQHPQYGKINNPKLDRGDFIFLASTEAGSAAGAEKRSDATPGATPSETIEPRSIQPRAGGLAALPKSATSPYEALARGEGPFLIDDFEDKNLWSDTLNDKWKYRTKGPAEMQLFVDSTRGANRTSSSLKIVYRLGASSAATVRIGGMDTHKQAGSDSGPTRFYDLSRFSTFSFYARGEQADSFEGRTAMLFVVLVCHSDQARSSFGQVAQYADKTDIVLGKDWQRVDIALNDFIPSPWTRKNVTNYPGKPDLRKVVQLFFMFSSFEGDGGATASNIIWIDEIALR